MIIIYIQISLFQEFALYFLPVVFYTIDRDFCPIFLDHHPFCLSVIFQIFIIFSKNTVPISAKLGTNHALEWGIQLCSNEESHPFQRRDNSYQNMVKCIDKMETWTRTTWLTSAKLGTKQPWDDRDIVKMHWQRLKIVFTRTVWLPLLFLYVTYYVSYTYCEVTRHEKLIQQHVFLKLYLAYA